MAPFLLFCVVVVLLHFGGHTQDDTQDVIVHLMPQSWQRSTSLCFVVLVLCLFCGFFVWFASSVVLFSMGPLNGLCIGPLPVLG